MRAMTMKTNKRNRKQIAQPRGGSRSTRNWHVLIPIALTLTSLTSRRSRKSERRSRIWYDRNSGACGNERVIRGLRGAEAMKAAREFAR
jgi:hypothetical protein